ncbi:uncharacterized protein BX663DRAFT_526707 [Cokeromyces recurvatus]|uniref:uncharacterized protein n=1 Tax=Cokeromyces recurvatus TaxID=90255 RepID=UPI0022209E07|nr:uncharacterized protein BX663DRAFT_526707 [Cokeromyces recurvatus]KAI7897863.1 hypothetical protein BX663DRAFT_526707 [Cokeromyces recurvatus]
MYKQIFEEVEIDVLIDDLNSVLTKSWSNMNMLLMFSAKYHFNKVDTTVNKAITALLGFWNEKISTFNTTSSLKKRAKTLNSTVNLVLDSRPALSIINSNIKKQLNKALKDNLTKGAYDELLEVYPNDNNSDDGSIIDNTNNEKQPVQKKRKYLKHKDLHNQSWGNKVQIITEYYGDNDVLDLTKTSVIPKRFKSIVENICKHFNLKMDLLLKDEEYDILKKISTCNNKEELYKSVQTISPFCNGSELSYIKMAVQKLCHLWHRNILNGSHHEDWYRVNVYGDLFDLIFIGQSGYETKRAECHSLIIKSLKKMGVLNNDTKNVRMDFIFSHTDGLSDAFYCEDKPNNNDLKDQKKTKNVREQSLKYWTSLLPYPECISYITAISCQFRKLTMHVTGSKLIGGILIHSFFKEVNIPSVDKKGASIAEYLATVLS